MVERSRKNYLYELRPVVLNVGHGDLKHNEPFVLEKLKESTSQSLRLSFWGKNKKVKRQFLK